MDAQAHCHAIGGHLLALETKEEYDSISANIPNERYHFGLNDLKDEGKYVWEHSGHEVGTYQPWDQGEPTDAWYEDCCFLRQSDESWHDVSCSQRYLFYFICEFAK